MWARSKATCTRCRNRVFVELTAGWGLAPQTRPFAQSPQPAGSFVSGHAHMALGVAGACLSGTPRRGLVVLWGGSFVKYPYAFFGFSLLCPCRRVVHDCCVARTYRAKDGCSETSFHGRRFLGPAVSSFPKSVIDPPPGSHAGPVRATACRAAAIEIPVFTAHVSWFSVAWAH